MSELFSHLFALSHKENKQTNFCFEDLQKNVYASF